MTPDEFRAARVSLGLTQRALAHVLGVDRFTVQRYEKPPEAPNSRSVHPVAARAMTWLLAGYRPPEWPTAAPPRARGPR